MAIRTPSKTRVVQLANGHDRFALLSAITPRVPLGTRRCCDVRNVGPVNPKSLKFTVQEWDACVQARQQSADSKSTRCNGIFFTAFAKKQSSRQCDLIAVNDGLCVSCDEMRKASKKEIVLPLAEYAIVKMAVFSRPEIKDCSQFWEDEAAKVSKEFKCPVQYPFFSAREVLDMILMEGMVIFEEGGRSGTSFPRSACIIQAQNDHVKACLVSLLGILIFEKRQQFKTRWSKIVATAKCIHEQMHREHAEDGSPRVGALQASDIIREELARASQVCKLKKCPARFLSLPVKRLVEWAADKKMKQPRSAPSSGSVAGKESSEGQTEDARKSQRESLDSVDTPASDRSGTNTFASKPSGPTPALEMVPVTQASAKLTLQEIMRDFSVPAPKKTFVQESTIPGAGQGLFLSESAKDKEMIGRYSGKVLSAEQVATSKSKYILRVNKKLFIDAEELGHLEGRYLNCARKAGRKVNVRFRASLQVNYCVTTGIAWVPFYAKDDIIVEPGTLTELLADYGKEFWEALEGMLMVRCSQESSSDEDEMEEDRDSDEDFVPPSSVAEDTSDKQRPATRSWTSQKAAIPHSAVSHSSDDLVWENANGKVLGPDGRASTGQQDRSSEYKKVSQSPMSSKENPATQLHFSSPDSDNSKTNSDAVPSARTVFAVSVGRCVGLFSSKVRMQQSLRHYPKGRFKVCTSVEEAEAYLATFSIPEPRKYWAEAFEEGSLLSNPHGLIHRRVCLPVGMLHGFYQPPCGFGTITNTSYQSGKRYWSVRMDTGFTDLYVQEWPLLCALEKARAVLGPAATAPSIRFHATRGVHQAGVFESASQVPQHIRHDRSKYRIFESRQEAQRWVKEWKPLVFFAVRGSENDGVDSDEDIALLRKNDHSEMRQFDSREAAEAWIAQYDRVFFALRGTEEDGVFTTKEDVLLRFKGKFAEYKKFSAEAEAKQWVQQSQCFVKCVPGEQPVVIMQDSLHFAKIQAPTAQFKGPLSIPSAYALQKRLSAASQSTSLPTQSVREHSTSSSTNAKSVLDPVGSQCIAQLADGSVCGRTINVRKTSVGMLCGWHASLINVKSATPHAQEPAASASETAAKESVVEASPDEGIRFPPGKKTLEKEKSNRFAVFALRTFPDAKAPAKPAGSIWLSSTDAEAANIHGGRIEMFNDDDDDQQDIFENIASAQSWIEEQIESKKEDSQAEFDRRLKASRSRTKPNTHGGRGGGRRKRGKRSRRGKGRGSKGGSKSKGRSRSRERSSDQADCDHSGEGSSQSTSSSDEDASTTSSKKGSSSKSSVQDLMDGLESRGGLRSGAARLLDKRQKMIEESLFYEDAKEVEFRYTGCPPSDLISMLPKPGEDQAWSRGKQSKSLPKLTFDNKMQAVLTEKRFKALPAFSLSDLFEFQQAVEHVAGFQPAEDELSKSSVVRALRLICSICVRVHKEMRDSGDLGQNGENFRVFAYLYVQFLVMYRAVFAGGNAEQFFWNKAMKFAPKMRGCPGMSPWAGSVCSEVQSSSSKGKSGLRCLVCGKPGHRADSEIHQEQMAEGSGAYSVEEMQKALRYVQQDRSLQANKKKEWSGRIKAFWAALKAGEGTEVP